MEVNYPTCPTSFVQFIRKNTKLKIEPSIIRKISSERAPVNEAMQLKTPVYGLNTGLGGNLAHELNEEDIQEFQEQLIKGRAVAVGESFSEEIFLIIDGSIFNFVFLRINCTKLVGQVG